VVVAVAVAVRGDRSFKIASNFSLKPDDGGDDELVSGKRCKDASDEDGEGGEGAAEDPRHASD
jgi:hypothetical protein